LRFATSPHDALAKAFAHATSADVAQVWVAGSAVHTASDTARPLADVPRPTPGG
jgi:hypothetical protein